MNFVVGFRKPTTRKGKKALLSKEPQVIEHTKRTLLVKGRKTGGVVQDCLKDFVSFVIDSLRQSHPI